MHRFLTIVFLFMTLIACGKKDSPKSDVQGVSPTVDKLTSTQWCSINKINQEFQVVSRYQFTRGEPNSFTVSYLGMNWNKVSAVYNSEESFAWVSLTDQQTNSTAFTVKMVEDRNELHSLIQAHFSEKDRSPATAVVLSLNASAFLPFSANKTEQVLFSCSDYSQDLTVSTPARPEIELDLLLAQANQFRQDINLTSVRSGLIKMLSFKAPIDQIKTSEIALAGSNWCSWELHDKPTTGALVNILSFGKSKYAQTVILDDVFKDSFWMQRETFQLPRKIFTILENQGHVRSEYRSKPGPQAQLAKIEEVFAAVTDAEGTVMLLKMNPFKPTHTLLSSFRDVYFKCDDPRPLSEKPLLRKNLPDFLDLQQSLLNKSTDL